MCENNWVKRIAGVRGVDRRKMDVLWEELCIEKGLMERLGRVGRSGEGHVERMDEDRLSRMEYVCINELL